MWGCSFACTEADACAREGGENYFLSLIKSVGHNKVERGQSLFGSSSLICIVRLCLCLFLRLYLCLCLSLSLSLSRFLALSVCLSLLRLCFFLALSLFPCLCLSLCPPSLSTSPSLYLCLSPFVYECWRCEVACGCMQVSVDCFFQSIVSLTNCSSVHRPMGACMHACMHACTASGSIKKALRGAPSLA